MILCLGLLTGLKWLHQGRAEIQILLLRRLLEASGSFLRRVKNHLSRCLPHPSLLCPRGTCPQIGTWVRTESRPFFQTQPNSDWVGPRLFEPITGEWGEGLTNQDPHPGLEPRSSHPPTLIAPRHCRLSARRGWLVRVGGRLWGSRRSQAGVPRMCQWWPPPPGRQLWA